VQRMCAAGHLPENWGGPGVSARDRLREYFRANVGKVLHTDDLRRVAGINEYARRIRELRNEEGMAIATHNDRSDLRPGEYILETLDLRAARAEPLPADQRFRILERDGYTCQVCGLAAGDPDPERPGRRVRLQVDHVVPRHEGGANEDDNLRALCNVCNEGRSNLIRPPRPETLNALQYVRRLPRDRQMEVYDFLRRKFGPR